MQFLPPLTHDAQAIAREAPIGRHLPYRRHVDDVTLETDDGLLMQVIRLDGLLFETADADEINYRTGLRDRMLRAIGSPNFAIWHHVVRRRVSVSSASEWPDSFSRTIDERWRARLAARELYVNDLYITIVRRPLEGRLGLLERAARWFGGSNNQDVAARNNLRELNAATQALISSLSAYAPRVLGLYEQNGALRSEPLEFLGEVLNGSYQPMLLPDGPLCDHLATRRISFGQDAIEHAPAGFLPRQFTAMVSIKDWPQYSSPGMFDALLRLPIDMTMAQSFAFVERRDALGRMNLALRRMRSAEDEALSLRDQLSDAKDEVSAGRAGFGEHHTSIAVRAETLELLNIAVAEVVSCLADFGINAVREDIALEPAFWAQFPGNFKYIARRGLISTSNFASFSSLHNFAVGQAHGNHWGEAITLLETTAAGPYHFNFHVNDLGNFTIIGPSGSGKTVVLNFLLAQARRLNPRIVFFDKDRGAELFIRAMGGRYDRLKPGNASGLNPLQLDDSPVNRQFLVEWLGLLVGGISGDEMALVADAIEANFYQPLGYRRLSHFAELLRGGSGPQASDLYARLQPWWGKGSYAWLFDNACDTTSLDEDVVGFDMTAILDDPAARSPVMLYLFHRVEERLDGTPSIITVDEGWKALDDDVFVARIRDWEKTIRKRNGIVGFATQSAEDALSSRIASAIIEQAATQIFMVNPKAREQDYMGGFGLTQHELELIRTMPDSAHCFLIRRGRESVVARLDLSGEHDLLVILSGRENTVRLFDEIVSEGSGTNDDAHASSDDFHPDRWLSTLLERAA